MFGWNKNVLISRTCLCINWIFVWSKQSVHLNQRVVFARLLQYIHVTSVTDLIFTWRKCFIFTWHCVLYSGDKHMDSCENDERWLDVQVLPMKADAMFRWDKNVRQVGQFYWQVRNTLDWTRCLIVSGTTNRQYRRWAFLKH